MNEDGFMLAGLDMANSPVVSIYIEISASTEDDDEEKDEFTLIDTPQSLALKKLQKAQFITLTPEQLSRLQAIEHETGKQFTPKRTRHVSSPANGGLFTHDAMDRGAAAVAAVLAHHADDSTMTTKM